MSADSEEREDEVNRKAAFIQIINNISSKILEVFKASKDQSQFEEAFNFYAGNLNTKLIMIIDQGFTKAHSSPILFEKSLKLLATICQFPIVDQLLTTPSDTP